MIQSTDIRLFGFLATIITMVVAENGWTAVATTPLLASCTVPTAEVIYPMDERPSRHPGIHAIKFSGFLSIPKAQMALKRLTYSPLNARLKGGSARRRKKKKLGMRPSPHNSSPKSDDSSLYTHLCLFPSPNGYV
jgi:hypothetical protein